MKKKIIVKLSSSAWKSLDACKPIFLIAFWSGCLQTKFSYCILVFNLRKLFKKICFIDFSHYFESLNHHCIYTHIMCMTHFIEMNISYYSLKYWLMWVEHSWKMNSIIKGNFQLYNHMYIIHGHEIVVNYWCSRRLTLVIRIQMGLMWRHIQVLGVKTGIQDNNAHNHKLAINGLR